MKKSVYKTLSVLTDTSNTPIFLEHNNAIGKRYHGYNVLKKFLDQSVNKNVRF